MYLLLHLHHIEIDKLFHPSCNLFYVPCLNTSTNRTTHHQNNTMDPQGGSALARAATPSIFRARSKEPAVFKVRSFFFFSLSLFSSSSHREFHAKVALPASNLRGGDKERLGVGSGTVENGEKEREGPLDVGTRLLLTRCVLINRDTRRELTTALVHARLNERRWVKPGPRPVHVCMYVRGWTVDLETNEHKEKERISKILNWLFRATLL